MRGDLAGVAEFRRSGELHGWAMRRFEASGASVERLVSAAIGEFCGDGEWVRGFVTEQVRLVVTRAVAGHRFGVGEREDEE